MENWAYLTIENYEEVAERIRSLLEGKKVLESWKKEVGCEN